MALQTSRVTDIGFGVCSAHESPVSFITTLQTGAATVLTNGLQTAIMGSIGFSTCGHMTVAVQASAVNINESQGVHRVTDMGTIAGGTYTMQTGSGDVISG